MSWRVGSPLRGCQDERECDTQKDLHPVRYNLIYASLKAFAEHLSLLGKSLGGAKAYYRHLRLSSGHSGARPEVVAPEAPA
ncbi:hypothetical protein [Pelagicoccus sp. SDUM812005]|uniref:hypothetical protein n=1 Tax=Pelagicoccus sp. SDUM812005 TaxID=3041257 RepID=UPI00280D3216|nr:hypothetical protein [Pelagicoccus sp. SDUM812005]MDQ8183885.1 hypothetical protein [Pelagicoccus sp. SDUM812005]